MGSNKILNLLLEKHNADLCVPECKTGSTWFGPKFGKLDLWVMKKSWAKPYTIGYEIKYNRSDFLRDTKWPEYLKYCTDFYFVAPPNIVQVEELPIDVGLIVTSKNEVRLYTKRKAIRREVEIPESIYRYILMWRTQVIRENNQSKVKYWQNWLVEKDEKKELGYNVSRKIGQLIKQRIDKVNLENIRLKAENENLDIVKGTLKTLGLDNKYISRYSIEDKIKAKIMEIENGIPEGLLNYLDSTIINLNHIKDKFTSTEISQELGP